MLRLELPNMTCGGCVNRVTRAIREIDPTAQVETDLANRSVAVTTDKSEADIRTAVAAAGYPAEE